MFKKRNLFLFIVVFASFFFLKHENIYAEELCKTVPVDVMLVLDRSGSMGDMVTNPNTGEKRTKLAFAKSSAIKFVNDLTKSNKNIHIGLVSFSRWATLDQRLSGQDPTNTVALISQINALRADDETCAECGISKANDELSSWRARNGKKIVIFLSDGQANVYVTSDGRHIYDPSDPPAPFIDNRAYREAKNSGNIFYTISYGTDKNKALLSNIANDTNGKYYSSPTVDQLNGVFDKIKADIEEYAAYGISGFVFEDTGNPGYDGETNLLPGWEIILRRPSPDGTVAWSGITTDGRFRTANVCDGDYILSLRPKDGWEQVYPSSPLTYRVTMQGGEITGRYFGVRPLTGTYTISGGIFLDEGGSIGRKDSTEKYTDGTNAPTGIISINGKSYTSGSSGFTSDLLPAGEYRVYFSSYPTIKDEYSLTYPPPQALIEIPYMIVKVGQGCTETVGSPVTCSAGNARNVNFGISTGEFATSRPWIRGFGGDMRVDWEMQNIIPNPLHFSEETTTMTPGVVFDGRDELNLGEPQAEKVSINKWIVKEKFAFDAVTTSYFTMGGILNKGGVLEEALPIGLACGGPVASCILGTDLANGLYTSTSDQEVIINNSGSYTFPLNKNFIFLIKGDLTINSNIIVPKGSSVLFIVGGDITVASSVINIEGVYSTDGFFTIQACECVGDDEKLTVSGSVIANASKKATETTFINERSLGENNDTRPSVEIIYRPDFVLNMPKLIRYKSYSIREVAPGSRIK